MGIEDKDQIFVHTTATRKEWMKNHSVDKKRDEIRRWHVEDRGWSDIGYAAIIDRDGSIAYGRDLDKDGDFYEETAAAARGYNTRGVHIALVGGFGGNANDRFEDHYTEAQNRALRGEIKRIMERVGKPMWVRGHNEVAAKACPCFQVADWWKEKQHRTKAGSKTLQAAAGAVATTVGGATAAVGQLDGQAQILMIGGALVIVLFLLFIMRERLKKWARGIE